MGQGICEGVVCGTYMVYVVCVCDVGERTTVTCLLHM